MSVIEGHYYVIVRDDMPRYFNMMLINPYDNHVRPYLTPKYMVKIFDQEPLKEFAKVQSYCKDAYIDRVRLIFESESPSNFNELAMKG